MLQVGVALVAIWGCGPRCQSFTACVLSVLCACALCLLRSVRLVLVDYLLQLGRGASRLANLDSATCGCRCSRGSHHHWVSETIDYTNAD